MAKKLKKSVRALMAAILLSAAMLSVAAAETDTVVLQAYVKEQEFTVFVNGELHADGLTCTVSNQSTDVTAIGSLSDEAALIKTTVLVDVSTSMPSSLRDGVREALKNLVDGKPLNEEIRLVSFGDEINVLQDFTLDRYDLANAIEKLEFNGAQSKIYDAVYRTIPNTAIADEKVTFYRTIVITDGVDDTESGITKEELYLKLQSDRYPVDVVAVSKSETAENKELSAIVRMSGGRYFSLVSNTDTAALARTLAVNNYSFFVTTVPAALLDGSTRQVDIDDGGRTVSLDVKFPVFGAPVTETAPSLPSDPTVTATPSVSETPTVTDYDSTSNPILNLFGKNTVIELAVIAVVVIIAIVVIVVLLRRKTKGATAHTAILAVPKQNEDNYAGATEFIGESMHNDHFGSQYEIKISDNTNLGNTWTLAVVDAVFIGRGEHCQIKVQDKSVSREQCKITPHMGGLVVCHVGTTNKTSLNGAVVSNATPLKSGDIIKFGRVSLRVDYIKLLSNAPLGQKPQQSYGHSDTESIF